jgi:hypothetical protein
MLNEFLKTDDSIEAALYKIGRVFGFFTEGSFKQYRYLLNEESDNEIQKLLRSTLSSLESCGAIISTDVDKVKWNPNFKVESVIEMMEQKKIARARQAQDRAKIKSLLRKYVVPGQKIVQHDIVLVVKSVDLDTLSVKAVVAQNKKWEHVFNVGFLSVWEFNGLVGDQAAFEAEPEIESDNSTQSLMYLYDDGKFCIERDS